MEIVYVCGIPLVFSTGSTLTTSSVSKCVLTLPLTLYVVDVEEVFDFLFDFVWNSCGKKIKYLK